jgi:hypothetical protein
MGELRVPPDSTIDAAVFIIKNTNMGLKSVVCEFTNSVKWVLYKRAVIFDPVLGFEIAELEPTETTNQGLEDFATFCGWKKGTLDMSSADLASWKDATYGG